MHYAPPVRRQPLYAVGLMNSDTLSHRTQCSISAILLFRRKTRYLELSANPQLRTLEKKFIGYKRGSDSITAVPKKKKQLRTVCAFAARSIDFLDASCLRCCSILFFFFMNVRALKTGLCHINLSHCRYLTIPQFFDLSFHPNPISLVHAWFFPNYAFFLIVMALYYT